MPASVCQKLFTCPKEGFKFHEELLENAAMQGNGTGGLRFRDAAQALQPDLLNCTDHLTTSMYL